MAISKTDIYNKAAILLGANIVSSPTESSKVAKCISAIWDMTRRAEFNKKPNWNFTIKMAQLAASATTPLFDRARSFPVPSDFICVVPPFPESNANDRDWILQNGQIYTNWGEPLDFRYVADITDVTQWNPLFAQAFAACLAANVCDAVTNSSSKLKDCNEAYKDTIQEARKSNAFDNVSITPPEDPWITARL